MDTIHRSLSIDTLSEYVAQLTTSVPEEATSNVYTSFPTHSKSLAPQHVLLSVILNVLDDPILFTAEEVPIETPDYVHEVKACSESDLYFLRWVFEGNFQALTDHISTRYPEYKILRAEAEPGINWAEFREGRRGFLVWLVTNPIKQDPLTALQTLLNKSPAANGDAVNARDEILAKLVGSHLSIFRRQLRSFHKAMDESEAEIAQIWDIVSSSGIVKKEDLYVNDLDKPAIRTAPLSAIPKTRRRTAAGANGENVSEWSVVDEYEERELTSLSGYETTSDGDLN
ncbi:hypothetical protein D0Z00_003888 [Geotrichum galactomycetum]|uniref:Uncharacterized protein n=1 Tax=Geotrichum galactomycetum TaxID=27317 RepID=A0ACB6V025_9ASCO|nr:hypothetical protein D0Z00_003888 [Geotrichum candidum]